MVYDCAQRHAKINLNETNVTYKFLFCFAINSFSPNNTDENNKMIYFKNIYKVGKVGTHF